MIYDYDKLCEKIKEVCGTHQKFASLMGLSERSISLKLNNKKYFKQGEIQKAIVILGIKEYEIHIYFFTPKVQCA